MLFARQLRRLNKGLMLLGIITAISFCSRAQSVKAIEYFFDNDPGVGNGTRINLSAATIIDTTVLFDMSSLSFGLHQLFVRALDTDDQWSLYHVYQVIKGNSGQPAIVQRMEYFFDNDPGTGNGTPISFLPSGTIDTTVFINTSSLSTGLHQVFIRAQDNLGKWSLYHTYPVIAGPGTYQPLTATTLEFFLDDDPGVGNGIQVPLQPGFIVDTTIYLQLPNASNDTVNLYVRAKDNRGLWGLYHDTVVVLSCALYQFEPEIESDSLVCINDSIAFTTTATAAQWHWSFGDGDSSTLQNPTHLYLQPGNYNVSLFVVSSTGCISDTTYHPASISQGISVDAGPDIDLFLGESVTLQPLITGNDSAYLWTPDLFMNNPAIRNPSVSPVDDITYTLTVTGTGGCEATDSVRIRVNKQPREIRIPNIFSPNGDGINDEWTIQFLNTYSDCGVQVFNRYGQKVFESKGYPTAWNGTHKGKALPFGTYYYVITIPGKSKPLAGYVTIIR